MDESCLPVWVKIPTIGDRYDPCSEKIRWRLRPDTPLLLAAMGNESNSPRTSLLNNLLQIQALENSIMQSTTSPSSPTTQSLLEQQIKLNQLQQLQQLQNQIFQQQMALITGQSTRQNSDQQLPTPGNFLS